MTEKRLEPLVQGPLESSVPTSFLGRMSDERKGVRALSIREFDPDGRFERTIQCLPGRLSIFQHSFANLMREQKDLQLRIGREQLHASEISFADAGALMTCKTPLLELLRSRGCAVPDAIRLSEELALKEVLDKAPVDMTTGERRCVAMILATFERARVVVFDQPFLHLAQEQVVRVAKFLATAAEKTDRGEQIYIATGVTRIPRPWRQNPIVRRSGRTGSSHRLKTMRSLVSKARELFAHSATGTADPSEQERIITRPQRVFSTAAANEQKVQTESIKNPSPSELLELNETVVVPEFVEALKDPRATSDVAAAPKRNQLTKVSTTMKIVRMTGVGDLLRRKKIAPLREPVLPTNVRVVRDRVRLRVRLITYVGIICTALVLIGFLVTA